MVDAVHPARGPARPLVIKPAASPTMRGPLARRLGQLKGWFASCTCRIPTPVTLAARLGHGAGGDGSIAGFGGSATSSPSTPLARISPGRGGAAATK